MKNWIYGRRLMEEQPGNGGEGGGGGGGTGGGTGGEGGGTGGGAGEGQQADDNKGGGDDKGAAATGDQGGEEEQPNAAAAALDEAAGNKPNEQPGDKPNEQKPKPGELTDEEKKAYGEAFKLDETTFGKGVQFDPKFTEKMPAFFKKYGIDPAKANEMANDFAKMQKEVGDKNAEALRKQIDERNAGIRSMNEAYLAKYDKAGREQIARAIMHYFPPKDANGRENPMFGVIRTTEVGVDPQFLALMHELGGRLPKDRAPGAAAGAGSGGGGKSLSDCFLGL